MKAQEEKVFTQMNWENIKKFGKRKWKEDFG